MRNILLSFYPFEQMGHNLEQCSFHSRSIVYSACTLVDEETLMKADLGLLLLFSVHISFWYQQE